MAQLKRTIVKTEKAPLPLGPYSQAIRTQPGELMFLAGQVAVNNDGNLVGAGDVVAQTRQIFENIGGVLSSAGASFSNIVEMTSYVVGRESVQGFIQARAELFPEIFPDADYPPNTLLVVGGLVADQYLVEVSAIAVLP